MGLPYQDGGAGAARGGGGGGGGDGGKGRWVGSGGRRRNGALYPAPGSRPVGVSGDEPVMGPRRHSEETAVHVEVRRSSTRDQAKPSFLKQEPVKIEARTVPSSQPRV